MGSEVLAGLLFKFAFMALLGFGMRKKGIINDDFQKRLSSMLISVVLPISILAVGNSQYEPAMAQNLIWAGVITVCFYLFSVPFLLAVSRPLKLSAGNKNLFVNLGLLANVGYIGLPIIAQMYGTEGTLYAIVFNLGFQFVAFTLGTRLMGGELSVRKFFTSPMTLAPTIAILIFVSPFRLPALVVEALSEVGGLSAAFSMFITGSSLACISFASLFKDRCAWLLVFLRQFFVPGVMAGLMWAAGFTGLLPATMVVIGSMPPGTLNVILAQQYDADLPFATRTVVLGTVLMVLTLPLWALVNSTLFF